MLTLEQQRTLLGLAREAILIALHAGKPVEKDGIGAEFTTPQGAFVTLTKHGELRGCIGYPEPVYPLYETIMRSAVSAALQDPRFRPVTEAEMREINIEISVLSPLTPISPEEVVIGTHGLVIEKGHARGLLLPQVPVEWGWDRDTYLEHLCYKANLPADAWRSGASLYGFTAEVISERELRSRME